MDVTKKSGTVTIPVYKSVLEKIVGGVTLATNRIPSATKHLLEGTLLDESANTVGLYQFVKTGKGIRTTAAATAISCDPKQEWNLGDFISVYEKTTQATITRITNSANTVWVATARALGTLNTDSRIVEVAAVGATGNKYQPSAMLGEDVQVRNEDLSTIGNVTASAVLRGSVDESRLPLYITEQHKTQLTDRMRFE